MLHRDSALDTHSSKLCARRDKVPCRSHKEEGKISPQIAIVKDKRPYDCLSPITAAPIRIGSDICTEFARCPDGSPISYRELPVVARYWAVCIDISVCAGNEAVAVIRQVWTAYSHYVIVGRWHPMN